MDAPPRLSFLSYAVNGSGLGHLVRQVAIQRWLRRYCAFCGTRSAHWFLTTSEADSLLHHEGFEQLVDPGRPVPTASTKIHGITPDMLQGQPDIRSVLGAFHAYAQDTVLVAHNAAFDMRFLQLKEADTGLAFDQPVLDTLLLSDLVHPQQESHGLEALAQRLGVQIVGRHTALGDAIVTAEVFLKLVPLLADKGIHTLGQAREAAQKSRFARVQY